MHNIDRFYMITYKVILYLASALEYNDAYKVCKCLDEWDPDEFLFEIMQEAILIKCVSKQSS